MTNNTPTDLDKTEIHTKITQLGIDYGYFWNDTLNQEPPEDCANRNAFTGQLMKLIDDFATARVIEELEHQLRLEWNAMNQKVISDRITTLSKGQQEKS